MSFHRFYSCDRKHQFTSKEEAEKRIVQIERKDKDGKKMKTYHCKICGGWHLATKKKRP